MKLKINTLSIALMTVLALGAGTVMASSHDKEEMKKIEEIAEMKKMEEMEEMKKMEEIAEMEKMEEMKKMEEMEAAKKAAAASS